MNEVAEIALVIRKGRTFSREYQLKTRTFVDGQPVDTPRNITGAALTMEFREVRGGPTIDLAPTFSAIDLSVATFRFTATETATDAMTTQEGTYEIVMTLGTVVSTEFEGPYDVVIPVVP